MSHALLREIALAIAFCSILGAGYVYSQPASTAVCFNGQCHQR